MTHALACSRNSFSTSVEAPSSLCSNEAASFDYGDELTCDFPSLPEFCWSESTHVIAAKADESTGLEQVLLRMCEIKLRSFAMHLFREQCSGHVLYLRQRKAELFQRHALGGLSFQQRIMTFSQGF